MTDSPEEKAKRRIRQLIWLYFWLLLIEGALRKWVVPRYSNPLLLVRDPVMLGIYFYAIRGHVFPKNVWVISLWVIGCLSLVGTIFLARFSLDFLLSASRSARGSGPLRCAHEFFISRSFS